MNIIDFLYPGDLVIWNKGLFGNESLFPTLLTTEVFGEGPFKVLAATDVVVPDDVWEEAEGNEEKVEQILKQNCTIQWVSVEGQPGEIQGYFFKLVKGT